jgi:hypothetical protein
MCGFGPCPLPRHPRKSSDNVSPRGSRIWLYSSSLDSASAGVQQGRKAKGWTVCRGQAPRWYTVLSLSCCRCRAVVVVLSLSCCRCRAVVVVLPLSCCRCRDEPFTTHLTARDSADGGRDKTVPNSVNTVNTVKDQSRPTFFNGMKSTKTQIVTSQKVLCPTPCPSHTYSQSSLLNVPKVVSS